MTTLQYPARQAKLAKAEGRNLMGTCSLTLRINETHYSVRGYPQSQTLWFWELRKLGTGTARVVYTVYESPDGPSCDCPSFDHHGADRSCKHIRALTARGLIRPVAPAPRSGLDGPAFDAEEIDRFDDTRLIQEHYEEDMHGPAAELSSPSKPVPDVTPISPPSFTLPDDIVAPDDEPFALASPSGVPAPAEATTGEYSPIVALLRGARERGLKYPSIEIRTPDGDPVVLKLCGEKSRTPGSVAVTNGVKYGEPGARYHGRIDEWGNDRLLLPKDTGLLATLRRLAADPAAVAAEHGHATGRCCFCSRELTDPKSVQVGYGPICASSHALPWG